MNLQERKYYKKCLIVVLKSKKKTKDNKYLRDFQFTPDLISECIHEKSKLITNFNISFHYLNRALSLQQLFKIQNKTHFIE